MPQEKIIVARLTGRLGNQLFQFAAGWQLAHRFNATLFFDSQAISVRDLLLPRVIGDLYQDAPRRLLWRFGRAQEAEGSNPVRAKRVALRAARFTLAANCDVIGRVRGKKSVFKERSDQWFIYDGSVEDLLTPCYLEGFFQHNDYFSSIEGSIATHALRQLPDFSDHIRKLSSGRRILGISFRRGDYNVYGAVLRLQWYEAALEMISLKSPDCAIIIFGDDPDFCFLMAEKLERAGYWVLDIGGLLQDPVDQLSIMAECDDLVIANSSFAWWGAFLGDWKHRNQSRTVIAPKQWIGGESYRLIRKGWIGV